MQFKIQNHSICKSNIKTIVFLKNANDLMC